MIGMPGVPALVGLAILFSAPAFAVGTEEPPPDPRMRDVLQLQEQGRFDLTVPMIERVLVARPGDPDILVYLALALRRTGRHADSEARYREALARDPNHRPSLAYQGVLYLETNRVDMARANLARLVGLRPNGCVEREDLERAIAARR